MSNQPIQPDKKIVPAGVQLLAYLGVLIAFAWMELPVWIDENLRNERLNGWLSGRNPDALPFLPFLFLFPLCWLGFQKVRRSKAVPSLLSKLLLESPKDGERSLLLAWISAFAVFFGAFLMSQKAGQHFSNLPPAFHDEYSYSLQAELFIQGRWSAPSFAAEPDLFDQMHVLNEGKFTSRYFPGTAFWMAPFAWLGNVYLGHQLAQALSAILIFWVGRELSNTGTGLLAGVLFALSPGMILFSNLLLAHHPTLVGLTLFLWSFLRMMRTGSFMNAFLAGSGLAFAMLCRPMTAASFGLPFGVVFVWWWLRGDRNRSEPVEEEASTLLYRSRNVLAMAVPLFVGFAILGIQNYSITGSVIKTPYSIYNDIYTPRHVYGFNNAIRGERESGPLVSDAYDRWAKNLTPEIAIENVQTRLINSLRWTLGFLPLVAAGIVFLFTRTSGDRRWILIALSVVSLHIAHIPYWFSGIMGWHYVFESAPLWLLIFAETTRRLFLQWNSTGRWAMKYCWLLFLGTAIAVNLLTVEPLWPARLERGIVELKFPRQLYKNFHQEVEQLRDGEKVIVFVIPDPADVSMDYVTNFPDWEQDVLVARIQDHEVVSAYSELFPDRKVLVFDAKGRSFE